MRRSAFTLVELLTVIAIISILYAIFMPVFISVKRFAQEYVAGQSLMKLSLATSLYATDNDETLPLGYYAWGKSRMNWFGAIGADGEVDARIGPLHAYEQAKLQTDASLIAQPWLGDETGFGYNWGFLGSDYYLRGGMTNGANCANAAPMSMLGHPSSTIEFGTSAFYYAKWLRGGDGINYRYGFVDPPSVWFGNPTLDFRHMGEKRVNPRKREVTSTGNALVVFVDGHLKAYKQDAVKQEMFERGEPTSWDEIVDSDLRPGPAR